MLAPASLAAESFQLTLTVSMAALADVLET
jgi:hypothetical protein